MNKITLPLLIFIIGLASQVTCANTLIVKNNTDNAPDSLRDAIANANNGDTIQFDGNYHIELTSDELVIDKSVTIDGSNNDVTISSTGSFRVFNIGPGAIVNLNNLNLQQGEANNGGGIFNDGLLLFIDNCTITNNTATNNGGGIYVNSGAVVITSSAISNNNATVLGGGIYNETQVTINNSTFYDNQAQQDGGAIYNNSQVFSNNSTFLANNANNNGGGLFNNNNKSANIKNNTFFENTALISGRGIYNLGALELTNTIIANSSISSIEECYSINLIDPNAQNLITDESCDAIIAEDPLLDPLLQDNGGTTPTHALLEGSPAIGVGDPSTCLSIDQRGKTRNLPCDIGAFEFNNAPVVDDMTFTTIVNTTLSDTLSATDVDGDDLTYTIVNSNLGTVNITDSTTGAFAYTPPLDQIGTDTFTYKVKDNAPFNSKESAEATVTINIINNTVVDNLGDTNDGNIDPGENTLREAIKNALLGDTITFANAIADQTIILDNSLIIAKDLTIDGTGQNITLSGGNNTRLFQIDSGNITINYLTLIDGKSEDGGAIQVNSGANLSLNDCTLFNNQNIGNSHQGGALFINTGAVVEINRCLIDSNKANGNPGHGGGIFNQGQLTLNNSTLTNNDANKGGGGLYNQTSAEINNSTFSANSTAQQDQGSNLYNGGTLKLRNTILANSGKNGGDCINNGGTIDINLNNLIEDDTCDTSATLITGDPKLSALQDNGGSTKTLALLVGSPAIDAGDDSTCLATDQRGESRPIDGNNDSLAICDIGAFEVQVQSGIPQQDSEPAVVSTVPTDNATDVISTAVITINFSESVEATINSFSLECPASNAVSFNLSASPATTFTLTPTSNLPFGTQCQVQVMANQITDSDSIDPPNNLADNYSFSFQTINQTLPPQPTIPSPPTDLQAVPDSATQSIKLSWNDNSNDETGFKITRDGKLLFTTAADVTTYQDNNLKCDTNYSYSVTALNVAGESIAATITVDTWNCPKPSPDPIIIPTPPDPTDKTTPPNKTIQQQRPTAPVELNVVAVSPTEVALSWNDTSHNETGFKIERDDILIHITASNVETYKDTELTCNTTYNYTVKATNTFGDSTLLTASVTMPTCATTPIAPNDLKITATSPTEVNLSWTDSSDNETGFKIERDGTIVHITLADITHYQDSGLTCGTNYHYQVTATNAIGDSPVIAQTITTLPCKSTNPLPPVSINLSISFAGDGEGQVNNSTTEIWCESSKDICIHYFKVPTLVTLVATAAEGSQFFSWEGDCQNTSDSIEFTLDSNQHCIANFQKIPPLSQDNTNNTSDSKDPEPCSLDNSTNCNESLVVNHPPMDIILSNQFIDENSLGGTVIGTLTTLDANVNEVHQYTLLDDANHTFILQGEELYLAEHAQLDFETIPNYLIKVRSTDSFGAFLDKNFTIYINDIHESQFLGKILTTDWQVGKNLRIDAPEIVNFTGYIKPQTAHLGQIANIIAIYDWFPVQPDQPTLNLPFTIAHQIPLEADMQVDLYEGRLIGLAGILQITLGYQLNNGENVAGQIIVLDISPNRPPIDIYLSNHTVMENSPPNTVIGWFTTTDPDRQDQFTYGLVDNPGNYFAIVGNELRVNHFHLHYDKNVTYPIKVRSVDMTGAYVDKNFTIKVIDTQSKRQDLQLTKTTVLENSPNGFIIGRLWNQNGEHSHYQYELIEDAQGRFALINDLIVIAKAAEFDFESHHAYPITVRSWQTDTQEILEKTFIIDILNVIDVTVRGKLYDVTYQPIDSSHLRSADEVTVELQLVPDQIHRGQWGEMLSVALWVAKSGETITYMLNGDTWEEWDGDLATLRSVQTLTLQNYHELTLWQDKLPNFSAGQFHIFGGYRLKSGEVVYSPQPFDVLIP
jgi:hypothetical protein